MAEDLRPAPGARTGSPPIVRVSGVAVDVLNRLRFERTHDLVTGIVDLREQLAHEATELSDLLYALIGELPPGAHKPRLVGLRRSVHRLRAPGTGEWDEELAAALPLETADRIRRWIAALRGSQELVAALPETLAAETTAKQAQLRLAAGDPAFRRALSHASPTLFVELAKWRRDETHVPRRHSLIKLIQYLARAATKTSPFSTFTISGAGVWREEEPAERTEGAAAGKSEQAAQRTAEQAAEARQAAAGWTAGDAPFAGVLELDGYLWQFLLRTLCTDPRLAPSLPLRVNPSATEDGGRISFLGGSPLEPILAVPATPAVRECLRVLAESGPLTADALGDRPAGGADSAKARRFVVGLLDAGLLERRSPVADQAADPLGALVGWLTASGGSDFGPETEVLRRLRTHLREPVPVSEVDAQWQRQKALEEAIGDLARRFEVPAPALRGKAVLHENAVFTGPAAELSLPHWRPALRDLDTIRRWLAPFGPGVPLRAALGRYFGERFGPGARVPFLAVHRAVQEELAGDDASGRTDAAQTVAALLRGWPLPPKAPLADSGLSRLRELSGLRERARAALDVAPDPDGVVRIDPARLAEAAATWPGWSAPVASLGCYVQPVPGDGPVRLVLNLAQHGHGRGRSRVLHLIGQAGGEATTVGAAPIEPGTADGTAVGTAVGDPMASAPGPASGTGRPETKVGPLPRVRAELGGMFATALNRRSPEAGYEIDYPMAGSDRPPEQRITPADLVVVHDPGTDLVTLVSERLGAEVHPAHLGMMADPLLPPAARLLVQAFGASAYVHPGLPFLTPWSDPADTGEISRLPRVEIGHVVIRRARWVVPAGAIPVRPRGGTDAEHLLRLTGWLREHGIPTGCFVRSAAGGGDDTQGAATNAWIFDRSRKPVYVDFANWFLVSAFERMTRSKGSVVVFEEALPAPGSAGLPYTTEFLIEVSEPDEDAHARSGSGHA